MSPNLVSLLQGGSERHSVSGHFGGRFGYIPALQRRTTAPLPDLWWMVSNSLPPATPSTIDISVNQGRLYRPVMSYPDIYGHTPSLVPAQSYTVASTVKTNILNGDQLWIKITWNADSPDLDHDDNPATDPLPVQDFDGSCRFRMVDDDDDMITDLTTSAEADHDHTPDGATPDGGHDHTITFALGSTLGSTSTVSAEGRYRGLVMTGATFEIYTTAAANALADDRENTYIHVATFAVTGTSLSISQRIAGCPITVYPIIFTYGAGIGD